MSNLDTNNMKFVFINSSLLIGGIETWIVNQIRIAQRKGIEVIWLQNGPGEVFDGWRDLIDRAVKIIRFTRKSRTNVEFDTSCFSDKDKITAVCFGLVDYYNLMLFRKKLKYINEIQCFYAVPHFQNARYYPEEIFSEKSMKRKIIKRLSGRLYSQCDRMNGLLFFSPKHIEQVQKKYGIIIEDKTSRMLPKIARNQYEFDKELAEKRSERSPFTIITCGRFEFPHKGYILGLIKSYAELKQKYPDIRLHLIGYGEGEKQILQLLQKYPPNIKNHVKLLGAVEEKELKNYFDLAHVNISVAGGVFAGAVTGLVSIPARHYCYDCEVYGYLPESKNMTLNDLHGEDVKKYIEDLITMPKERYISLCRKSFETYQISDEEKELYDEDRLYLLKNKNPQYYKKFIRKYCLFEIFYHFLIKIHKRRKRISNAI